MSTAAVTKKPPEPVPTPPPAPVQGELAAPAPNWTPAAYTLGQMNLAPVYTTREGGVILSFRTGEPHDLAALWLRVRGEESKRARSQLRSLDSSELLKARADLEIAPGLHRQAVARLEEAQAILKRMNIDPTVPEHTILDMKKRVAAAAAEADAAQRVVDDLVEKVPVLDRELSQRIRDVAQDVITDTSQRAKVERDRIMKELGAEKAATFKRLFDANIIAEFRPLGDVNNLTSQILNHMLSPAGT